MTKAVWTMCPCGLRCGNYTIHYRPCGYRTANKCETLKTNKFCWFQLFWQRRARERISSSPSQLFCSKRIIAAWIFPFFNKNLFGFRNNLWYVAGNFFSLSESNFLNPLPRCLTFYFSRSKTYGCIAHYAALETKSPTFFRWKITKSTLVFVNWPFVSPIADKTYWMCPGYA